MYMCSEKKGFWYNEGHFPASEICVGQNQQYNLDELLQILIHDDRNKYMFGHNNDTYRQRQANVW